MEDTQGEKRKFPRIKVELVVRYKALAAQENSLIFKDKQVSAGGICLVTFEPFKQGTILATEIQFPHSNKTILYIGRTAWSSSSTLGPSSSGQARFDNGIEFLKVSEAQRRQILRQIDASQGKNQQADWQLGIAKDLSE